MCIKLLYKCKHTRIHRPYWLCSLSFWTARLQIKLRGTIMTRSKCIRPFVHRDATANSGFICILASTARASGARVPVLAVPRLATREQCVRVCHIAPSVSKPNGIFHYAVRLLWWGICSCVIRAHNTCTVSDSGTSFYCFKPLSVNTISLTRETAREVLWINWLYFRIIWHYKEHKRLDCNVQPIDRIAFKTKKVKSKCWSILMWTTMCVWTLHLFCVPLQ